MQVSKLLYLIQIESVHMIFKSLLLVVIFIPTLTMAQAPVIAPPAISDALVKKGAFRSEIQPHLNERRGNRVSAYPAVEADGSFKGGVTYRYVVEPTPAPAPIKGDSALNPKKITNGK